jgi:hypothetical protein
VKVTVFRIVGNVRSVAWLKRRLNQFRKGEMRKPVNSGSRSIIELPVRLVIVNGRAGLEGLVLVGPRESAVLLLKRAGRQNSLLHLVRKADAPQEPVAGFEWYQVVIRSHANNFLISLTLSGLISYSCRRSSESMVIALILPSLVASKDN